MGFLGIRCCSRCILDNGLEFSKKSCATLRDRRDFVRSARSNADGEFDGMFAIHLPNFKIGMPGRVVRCSPSSIQELFTANNYWLKIGWSCGGSTSYFPDRDLSRE